jgi:hypothetical protein
MAAQAQGAAGRNWRRIFFYVVEITFAIIAGTGESFMYAAYLPEGPERWPEAIARATITQVIIILFGVAAIESWGMRNAWARIFFTLAIWGVTIGAGIVTFWFLWEAAQVFRDTAMLAPLKNATIDLPNGWTIPNWMIDVALIAALPFFQTVLNILAPIITADHATETLEHQQERQARELAQARFNAEKAALQAQGFGAMLGGGFRALKTTATGQQGAGLDDGKSDGSSDESQQVAGDETTGYDSSPSQPQIGQRAPVSMKKVQWTSRQLKQYAKATYDVIVPDTEAQRAMSVLKTGKDGNFYIAPRATVKKWVDDNYTKWLPATQATGTSER